MKVQFGVTLQMGSYSQEFPKFGEICRFLDESGYAAIWISDEQSLRREMYASMAVAALNTERIKLIAGPTNPFTRHPAVTASAISTIDEISGGRAVLLVSIGFSNVENIGLRPAKLADLEEYIQTLRALWRDHETIYQGRTIRLLWNQGSIPLYMIAEGPKTLRLAGRIADGVIVGMGHTPEVIEGTLNYLRQGAEEVGRRLDDLDIWWQTRWNIAESYDEAVEGVRGGLSAAAGHALSRTFEGKFVPPEFEEPIRNIQKAYAYAAHGSPTAAHTMIIDEVPGLKSYLAERFAIAGTAQQFIERVEKLADLGLTQFRLGVGGKDRDRQLRILAEEVIPHFQ